MQRKFDLGTIKNGAILEMFDEEMKKVLANIEDENTSPTAERSVTIRIGIRPNKLRNTADVKTQVKSTLAPVNPAESFVFFDVDEEGEFAAYADDPGPELPGISEQDNVRRFPRTGTEG